VFDRYYLHLPTSHCGQRSGLGLGFFKQNVELFSGIFFLSNIQKACAETGSKFWGVRFVVHLPV
jgi:hypothetical protein